MSFFTDCRYRYNAKEQDEESGFYYYGARYYLPWLCRFSSVDPKALEFNWQSSYVYADNNPVKFVDVNGEGAEKNTKQDEKKYGKLDYSVQKLENDKTTTKEAKVESVHTKKQLDVINKQKALIESIKQQSKPGKIDYPSTDFRSESYKNMPGRELENAMQLGVDIAGAVEGALLIKFLPKLIINAPNAIKEFKGFLKFSKDLSLEKDVIQLNKIDKGNILPLPKLDVSLARLDIILCKLFFSVNV